MPTLAEIKAKLVADEEAKKSRQTGGDRPKGQSTGDQASFPFWNIPVGATSTVRLTPDGNEKNVLPWVNKQTIELDFDGVVGGDYPTSKRVTVKVPCVDMFRASVNMAFADLEWEIGCPIQNHTRNWWAKKGEPETAQSRLARKYWKKNQWLMQGFHRGTIDESGKPVFIEEAAPENPLRRFVFGKKIYDKIYKGFYGTMFEVAPNDFVGGCDFEIVKSKLGDNNNYDNSNWARRESSLTSDEMGAIEQYGLYDLKEFVGKVPTKDGVDAIYAMFLDSLDGKPFDFASYGEFYRPYGGGNSGGGERTNDIPAAPRENAYQPQASAPEQAPASTGAPAGGAQMSATDDLIARIRNRQGN